MSKTVMVLLVGGRAAPNVLGVMTYRPDAVEYVVSEDEPHRYEETRAVLEGFSWLAADASPRWTDAFNVQAIRVACGEAVDAHPDANFIFNVTCATKVMAIVAYEYALTHGWPAIYIATAHRRSIQLTEPFSEQRLIPLRLEEYLACYGRRPEQTFEFERLSVTQEQALAAARILASAGQPANQLLAMVRRWGQGSGRRMVQTRGNQPVSPDVRQVLDALIAQGLIQHPIELPNGQLQWEIACDADFNFLCGTWLEVYVWDQTRQCRADKGQPLFDDVRFSLEIPSDGARKEIDVACMYQGQLLHCSCKTETNPFKTATLDELRAVSSLVGGRFCTRLFVTSAFPPPESSTGTRREFERFLAQARDREIVVVTGDRLPAIGEELQQQAIRPTHRRV
ncbi:MAG TPA: DUF1887 family protein [Anaerolineae bacterium]|nr:DUF1887 family protein [Anaerolineae bacterium]